MFLKRLSPWLLYIVVSYTTLYARSAIVLNDNEKAFLQNHPVITVHNEKNYPPYNFNKEGKATGFSIDYMNLLAEKLNLEIKYISGPEWSEFLEMTQSGELDVMLNIVRTPAREAFLHFTEPYAATKKAIYSNEKNLDSLQKLKKKVVCVPEDFYIQHFLEAYYPDIILLKRKSTLACLRSVVEGSSQATVGSRSIINYLMHEHNIVIPYSSVVPDKRLTVGLSIATAPKMKILRDILQKAMYSISEDVLVALSRKWIGTTEDESMESTQKSRVYAYAKTRVVTMCNNPNWAPIEFAKEGGEGQMQGIAIDTLKILEKKLNIRFKTIPTKSWTESQDFLREGKCEILPAAISTERRKSYANFTTPYLVYKLAIITKDDKPFVEGLADIADKTVARKKGSGLISKLKTPYPHIHIIETTDYKESLKKVALGEAYCTIATLPVASYFINQFSLKNLQIAGYTDIRYRLSIAVNKKDTMLLKVLNDGLSEISQNEQKRIYEHWVNEKLVETFDYRYLLYPLFAGLAIFLALLYRQRLLKKNNQHLQTEINKKVQENLTQHQFIQEQTKMAALGEMIGVIAHQWRQPLNVLALSIQNLEYHYKDGLLNQEFIEKFIEKNLKTIQFMSHTIDDFKDFFKVDKVKEKFSVKESIEATFHMQSLCLEKYHISFVLHGDDFAVEGLRSEFQQLILNLISNAKDALVTHREEGRRIEVYLEERAVVFMDNGGGIPDAVMEKMFDSYFSTKEEGLGIGLYMSKIIIEEKMGGIMRAHSKGDGTVIVLEFKDDETD